MKANMSLNLAASSGDVFESAGGDYFAAMGVVVDTCSKKDDYIADGTPMKKQKLEHGKAGTPATPKQANGQAESPAKNADSGQTDAGENEPNEEDGNQKKAPSFDAMSTGPQHVLLEDFTAHQCGNCPPAGKTRMLSSEEDFASFSKMRTFFKQVEHNS